MDTLYYNILTEIIARIGIANPPQALETTELLALLRAHNKNISNSKQHLAKKHLMPYYLRLKQEQPEAWEALGLDKRLESALIQTLKLKPRRTSSGVATITVITKPWTCSSACLYCPNDIRMPKSYLSDEPACQRAERNYFDPYLQVATRLKVLQDMGHTTDKIELIILGGTWSNYPLDYQRWFIKELFCALNDDAATRLDTIAKRRAWYEDKGIACDAPTLKDESAHLQQEVSLGKRSFNDAIRSLYLCGKWKHISSEQKASLNQVSYEHERNEAAENRVVGLVVETQPDLISPEHLYSLRQLGATKVQIGVQSLRQDILDLNKRPIRIEDIQQAFTLLRLFGFKIHAHFMANLYGANPQDDALDYAHFVSNEAYRPDEIKMYPCALIQGTQLVDYYEQGLWQPYTEEELIDLLVRNVVATPPFVRISRMIRDFSAHDIVVGNKKVNLRQLVELHAQEQNVTLQEIRYREINQRETALENLKLDEVVYNTLSGKEYFLQWITPHNNIAGFLRLSLPHKEVVNTWSTHECFPIRQNEAMIREIHIYGQVAALSQNSAGAQHLGLGRKLIAHAEAIARKAGYTHLNVISAIGTRHYYRNCGFSDNGLYQTKALLPEASQN